jgi:tripartite-type tricarboxylate transporter receptor subunit TctC
MKMRKRVQIFLLAVGALSAAAAAWAQAPADYPTRPIRLVIPYAAGGGVDTVMRAIAPQMSETLGQPLVVENRPGGGTINATDYVAKAPADGYTLLATGAPIYLNTALGLKLPYDPLKDLAPVSLVVNNPGVIVVSPDVPVKTIKELVAFSQRSKDGLNYGSAGVGSIGHLGGELLKAKTGVKMTHIPYKGSAPALVDLMGGQLSVLVDALIPTGVQVKAGKGVALAVMSAQRSPVLPEVPTLAEAGYPGVVVGGSFGMMAPGKTPPAIIEKVHAAMLKAVSTPQTRKQLMDMGYEVIANSPAEYGSYIRQQIGTWTQIVKDNDIKPE